jgi:hypothetical protein
MESRDAGKWETAPWFMLRLTTRLKSSVNMRVNCCLDGLLLTGTSVSIYLR